MIGRAFAPYIIGGVAIVALFIWFRIWLARHDEAIKAGVIVEINEATKELANEAVEARLPSLRPGAALRLREFSCRDCSSDVPSGR